MNLVWNVAIKRWIKPIIPCGLPSNLGCYVFFKFLLKSNGLSHVLRNTPKSDDCIIKRDIFFTRLTVNYLRHAPYLLKFYMFLK